MTRLIDRTSLAPAYRQWFPLKRPAMEAAAREATPGRTVTVVALAQGYIVRADYGTEDAEAEDV